MFDTGSHVSRHLVPPIRGPLATAVLRERLQAAHDYLARAAQGVVPRLAGLPVRRWGIAAKREPVRLGSPRPDSVTPHVDVHSFAEVVNQCATLERLLDAVSWAETEFGDHLVQLCNPTTSSNKKDPDDHDLVLVAANGTVAKFEVGDVASTKDSNRKELKDLCSLGALKADGSDALTWPSARLFLVVSSEFATRLRRPDRHGLKRGSFHYRNHDLEGCDTVIFEVVRGPRAESGNDQSPGPAVPP